MKVRKKGNQTAFNLFLTPKTSKAFKVNVWMDGPWDNATWKGKKIGEIQVPAGSAQAVTQFTVDVSAHVDGLSRKHAIYLVAEGDAGEELFRPDRFGIQFGREEDSPSRRAFCQHIGGWESH